jgi:hypothetical protein
VPPAENIIKTCRLGGGPQATVSDLTIHYFGGYYLVRILVRADVPVTAAAFDGTPDYQDAVKRLGTSVSFSRTLEKMAVPDSEMNSVRQQLLSSFDTTMLPYLMRDDFADSFVRSEYRKALKSSPVFHR